MNIFKINIEEKKINYVYILILWILFSIIFIAAIFHNNKTETVKSAKDILNQMKEKSIKHYQETSNIKNIDSLILLLSHYKIENNNSYIESNIIYELNEIKNLNKKTQKTNDIYIQTNDFYSTLFYDKKTTWNTLNNITFLKDNLNKCEIGFQQNQNNITLLETLQNNSNKE